MERSAETAAARARLLALIASVLVAAIPLLPIYGNGHQTIFSLGYPGRFIAGYLVGGWTSPAVIVIGIVLLTRSRHAMAVGVFLAVAIHTLIRVANPILVEGGVPGGWQGWLGLVMGTAAGILLILAVTAARHATQAGNAAVDGLTPTPVA